MIDAFGWMGTILLAICGIPQLIKCFKEKHAHGVAWLFLLAWFFGELFFIIFVVLKDKGIILILNYGANLAIVGGILWYKIKPYIKPVKK